MFKKSILKLQKKWVKGPPPNKKNVRPWKTKTNILFSNVIITEKLTLRKSTPQKISHFFLLLKTEKKLTERKKEKSNQKNSNYLAMHIVQIEAHT